MEADGDRGISGLKGWFVAVAAAICVTELMAADSGVAAVVYDQSGEFELNHAVGESPCVTSGSTTDGREVTKTGSVSFTHLPEWANRYNDLLCITKCLIPAIKLDGS